MSADSPVVAVSGWLASDQMWGSIERDWAIAEFDERFPQHPLSRLRRHLEEIMGLLVMIDLKELHEGERDIFAHAVCIVSAGFYVGRCRGAYGDIWKKSGVPVPGRSESDSTV